MAEKPIIFSGEMVRAILDGRKTQTRRIVKLQKRHSIYGDGRVHPAVQAITHRGDGWWGFDASGDVKQSYVTTYPFFTVRCPYSIGDTLWVREEHFIAGTGAVFYRADGKELEDGWAWRPSIHMPRWASRISLEITDIRVQRVQEISGGDAVAEGYPHRDPATFDPGNMVHAYGMAIDWYRDLWNRVNGPGAWERNDWVWCYTFRRINNAR